MKKTKLLTSVLAFVLVLSAGGCSQAEEPLPNPNEVIATNPAELVEKANTYGNYSVEIEYDYYESVDTMTYDEYLDAYNGDSDALEKYYSLVYGSVLEETILLNLYYDRDYIYAEGYYIIDNVYYLALADVVVNTDEGVWEYSTYDGQNWYYYTPDLFATTYGARTWEEYFGSLFAAYESGVVDHLEYIPSYGAYDFDDWTYNSRYGYYVSAASAEWFVDLGLDFLFGDYAYSYAYYDYEHYQTLFYRDYQVLESLYWFSFVDYVEGSDEDIYYGEEDIWIDVYDVGTTDQREAVDYYHDYFQSVL